MITKTLKTLAKDNHNHIYSVTLRFEELQAGQTRNPENGQWWYAPCNKWVLVIEGTPGRWYISTLLENDQKFPDGIAIDFGQKWYCTNFQEVLNEAKDLI